MNVVSRDIFHHAAAALRDYAFACDELHAEEVIARGAVELAQRTVDTLGDGSSDGGLRLIRRAERQELTVLCENSAEFVQGDSRFDTESQIAGIIGNDAIKASHVQRDVVLARRQAHFEFCAGASRDDGELFLRCEFYDF